MIFVALRDVVLPLNVFVPEAVGQIRTMVAGGIENQRKRDFSVFW